jgi:hypothetical protein
MNVHRLQPDRDAARLRVVETGIARETWLALDLKRIVDGLPGQGTVPAGSPQTWQSGAVVTTFWPQASARTRDIHITESGPQRGRHVPERDIVSIQPMQALPSKTKLRPLWRDLLMLTALAVTLAGTFWIGRTNGFTKVIVIPETWTRQTAIS